MQQLRRSAVVAACLLAVAAIAVGVGSAAAAGGAPKAAKLFIKGALTFKIDQYTQDSVHYAPATTTIRSGGTLTIVNQDRSEQEPHTFSIVKRSQLPHSLKQMLACASGSGVCGQVAASHGVNTNGPPTNGPPPKPVVDVGAPGVDQPGDSDARLAPGFKSVTEKITAKAGTTLYYFCAVHPWMQGKIIVK
jgi:plastocyanin